MNSLILAIIIASEFASSGRRCEISYQIYSYAPVVKLTFPYRASQSWKGISEADLIARVILSEMSGRVIDPDYKLDAIGIGWVVRNRTLGLHPGFNYGLGNVLKIVTSPNQFHGIYYVGNAKRAANPNLYWRWYGSGKYDGARAYWIAYQIAKCIIDGRIKDPTNGALFFSDAYYVHNGDGKFELVKYKNTHFRNEWSSSGRSIAELNRIRLLDHCGVNELECK